MGMYDSAEKLREEFKELFKEGLTFKQLWWVIKMMRAARFYCRSNVAFNNFVNQTFKGFAEFRQVEKEGGDGKKYKGLSVMLLNPDGTFVEEVVASNEED